MSPRRPGRWDLSDLAEAAPRWRGWPPPAAPPLAGEPSIPFGPPSRGSRELLHCTGCASEVPLASPGLAGLGRATALEHGFELERQVLVIYGVCRRCRARRRRQAHGTPRRTVSGLPVPRG